MTVPIMLVLVACIFYVAKIFGFGLEIKALFLCVVLAFGINFGSIYLSITLAKSWYFMLGVLMLLGALTVTFYNERLIFRKRLKKEPVAALTDIERADFIGNVKSYAILSKKAPLLEDTKKKEPVLNLTLNKMQKGETFYTSPPVKEEQAPKKKRPLVLSAKKKEAKPSTVAEVKQFSSQDEEKIKPAFLPKKSKKKAESLPVANTCNTNLQSKELPEASEAKIRCFRPPRSRTKTRSSVRIPPMPSLKNSIEDKILKLKTLDDFLNLAFEEKLMGNLKNAVYVSKIALKRYIDDDYAPFIIITIGNIYKVEGDYEEAIKTYEDALKLSILKSNEEMRVTFKENILYLKIVQKILAFHARKNLPFDQIPKTYREEIEREFNKKTNKKGTKP